MQSTVDKLSQDVEAIEPPGLAGVAVRYPEKTLFLGRVFKDRTNSYKFVWFLAMLSLVQRNKSNLLLLADILSEMAVVAWHPVCLFRLSLGCQDKLQNVILTIQNDSNLELNEKPDTIRTFLNHSSEAQSQLGFFRRYVPTRFLVPWFAEKLRGTEDSRRDLKIQELAKESQRMPVACPYWFDGENIRFNQSWQLFLSENIAVIQAFAEYQFAIYLQSRNPNVPGVVNKLRAPVGRQLNQARQFWNLVRNELIKQGRANRFRDIYSDQTLTDTFSIDHFLPWSFVVHDLFWNLTPVELTTNSAKNDMLPDLELYLPRLSKLHFDAIDVAKNHPKLLEDYSDCFRLGAPELLSMKSSGLEARFREIIVPQAQIAINQGFQSGWRLRSQTLISGTQGTFMNKESLESPDGSDAQNAVSGQTIIKLVPNEGQKLLSEFLPFYSLKIAASGFLSGDAPEPEGWIEAVEYGFSKRSTLGMFVTQIVGGSMEPTIKNGSYCVFRSPVEGTRQGRIVLVQNRNITDLDTGGSYTVKRYQSTKSTSNDTWGHQSILLIPDNPDREKYPILEFSHTDEADLRVIAEFVQMLTTRT